MRKPPVHGYGLAAASVIAIVTFTSPAYASQNPAPPGPALTAAVHPASRHHYRVRHGDTLTSIARREYGHASRWPALWWINKAKVHNPNLLRVGQRLRLSQWHPRRVWLASRAVGAIPKPPPPPVVVASYNTPAQPPPVASTTYAAQPAQSYSGSGSFEQCVIARESGGNAHAVNASSGAGGLYQFLPSTWASLGYSGAPQDAPVSVQRQAFQKLYAEAGTSPWSPSDHC